MDKLLPDPFSTTVPGGKAEQWFRERALLLPIPNLLSHKPAEFSVRVLSCLEPMFMTSEDAALMQLLYAARQRLTARLSEVQTLGWQQLKTPVENPLPYEVKCPGDIYNELSLFHAQLRMLTATYPQLGLYNEAWELFCEDMGRYAPWRSSNNDSTEWCALVLRQQAILVEYEAHRADYERAQAKWAATKHPLQSSSP